MKYLLAPLCILMICITAFSDEINTDWPSLRNSSDAKASCLWPETCPSPTIRDWQFTSKTNRRYKPGLAVWASPAVAIIGGRPMAFIGGYDQALHALRLDDKQEAWAKLTNGEIQNAPAVGYVENKPVVFWGSADRTIYAYFAVNGLRLWTRELVPPTNTMGDAIVSSPLLHNGTLYITCFVYDKALARNKQKGYLFALDMASGRELWCAEICQGPMSSPVGAEIDGRFVVFVAAQKGLLQAFDVAGTPSRIWYFQMPHEVLGSPAIDLNGGNPILFLGSKFGNLIAIDARTGKEKWQQMAGNWIDNGACVGSVDGTSIVYVGSHDYNVYAFRSVDGKRIWRKRLGGEVYSAPAFFHIGKRPAIAVASLDNHLHVLDAATGAVITSYYTGTPIWDKVNKGETLWGSPAVFQGGMNTSIIHGSFNDTVYVLPLNGESPMRAKTHSAASLWVGLFVTLVIFGGVILPAVLYWKPRFERGQ